MKPIQFIIPGKATGKQRPFFAKGRAFTPKATVSYENLVKSLASEEMGSIPPIDRPLHVDIMVRLLPPQSKTKGWKEYQQRGWVGATVTPDLDNVAKAITDAMNKIVYHDDKQIISMVLNKEYADVEETVVRVAEHGRMVFPANWTARQMKDEYSYGDAVIERKGKCDVCGIAIMGREEDDEKTICTECEARV